jgi:nucleoside-diphosphate-sugar epimerase
MKLKVLVLGSSGFIGSHLISRLSQMYEIIEFEREKHVLEETISDKLPDIVINCSASKVDATWTESFEANIEFQLKCLKILLKYCGNSFKWIQVGSYFEMQIPLGRVDNYSLDKQICRSILNRLQVDGHFKLTTIFLPHIFGKGEDINRIIPSLIENLQKGQIAEISRGEQFLPILGIEDCCSAIAASILTDQLICSASPIWYDKVKVLASIMEKEISKGTVRVNTERISIDNSFPKIKFPSRVKNWMPQMTFDDFIAQLSVHNS